MKNGFFFPAAAGASLSLTFFCFSAGFFLQLSFSCFTYWDMGPLVMMNVFAFQQQFRLVVEME